jgi:spoIIIJ-associated protein
MDHLSDISKYTAQFLEALGFTDEVKVSVNLDKQNNLYQVLFQTSEPSLLIGYHGDNLFALQSLLGLHLHAKFDEWINLSLNVNDYRERREFTLHSLADTAVSRVIATGHPHSLPPMSSSERRLVHLYLSNHPRVSTSSQGQGRNRSIIVSPKSS